MRYQNSFFLWTEQAALSNWVHLKACKKTVVKFGHRFQLYLAKDQLFTEEVDGLEWGVGEVDQQYEILLRHLGKWSTI